MVEHNEKQVNKNEDRFVVDQLISEYQRRSDVMHKAVDNYYVVLGIMFSAIAALLFATSITSNTTPLLAGAIPFVVLSFMFIDGQIRTTVYTNSTYIIYLEKRINELFDYPLLLWESSLSPGQIFYYKRNRYMLLRAASFLSFVIIAAIAYAFSVNTFLIFLKSRSEIDIFGVPMESETVRVIYLVILITITVISLVSWLLNYTVLPGVYAHFINQTSDKILGQYESELDKHLSS